ncbi:MAG: hypothetical protein PHR15_00220 [Atopobiaceae bacterium]|jgi:hypothetical protein|nr:hypothetical protein [Atopobiaceae bacterium]MCH4180540.1 hypothetical protein [Atopobiaceae bacterium]MCH4214265.1 hypothetical protein [Atopobiaceae bacterium]MCH4229438.1 hypothetical protein [Atopobiaceae bacterium]MCH4276090.1 hypothetical protein [Atopobiaceae bacterium]
MTIFFGYRTGIELWRRPEICLHASFSTSVEVEVPDDVPEGPWHIAGTVSTIMGDTINRLERPWDLITSKRHRPSSEGDVTWHLCTVRLPPGSGSKLDDDVFLSTPEFCLLQMAEVLSLPALVELMDEFCGTYRPRMADEPHDGEKDTLVQRDPLTSRARIADFLDSCPGLRGNRRARQALAHVVDGSASPKEAQAEMLFSLPRSWGGRGLPRPVMNARFPVPGHLRRPGDSAYVVCDICWPVRLGGSVLYVAVEYQSTAWHVGAEKLAADSRRRNLLESMGVHVITLTAAELYSQEGFDRVADLVFSAIGLRDRSTVPPEVRAAQAAELREELLHRATAEGERPSPQM